MKIISFSESIREALRESLLKFPELFIIGEDIAEYGGAFGVTRGLLDEFGKERIINTPISEASFTGIGIGAALLGSKVVIEIMFMDFITLAADQIVNSAAKLYPVFGEQAKCPIVIRAVSGAGRGYGPTHSQSLHSWFVHIPGLKVVAPSNCRDAYHMLTQSIEDDFPIIFIEDKTLYPVKEKVNFNNSSPLPLHKSANIVFGNDITVITFGKTFREAYYAAKVLSDNYNIKINLIDLRSLKPLDEDTIFTSVKNTGRVLIAVEEYEKCGIAAEIAARISEEVYDYLDAPVKRLTLPDDVIPADNKREKEIIPDRIKIEKAIINILSDR